MSNVTSDIVAKLWNLCNVLEDDGDTNHQYVTELTWLLFPTMANATLPPRGRPSQVLARITRFEVSGNITCVY